MSDAASLGIAPAVLGDSSAKLLSFAKTLAVSFAKTPAGFTISKIPQGRVTCYMGEFRRRTQLLRTTGVVASVHAFAPEGKARIAEKQNGAVMREAVVSWQCSRSPVAFDAVRGFAVVALQKSVIGIHGGGGLRAVDPRGHVSLNARLIMQADSLYE